MSSESISRHYTAWGSATAPSPTGRRSSLSRLKEDAGASARVPRPHAASGSGSGTSDVRSFQSGRTFELTEHPRADWNRAYLLSEVRHQGRQELELAGGAAVVRSSSYENRFVAHPADLPFRPERVTPRPRVAGTLHAFVDAAGDGTYAEIDDQGRYKLKLPLDLEDRGSRPVRKAQPYGGPDYGMHFPLHKKTEVILTCQGGDPDRPIIVGAMPNPETVSPVTSANFTQCVLRSAGRNALVYEDQSGSERLFLRAERDQEIRVQNDAVERIGRDRHLTVTHDRIERVGNDHHERIDRDHVLEIGGSRHTTLRANDIADVGGRSSLTVEGDVVRTFLSNCSETITGRRYVKAGSLVLESEQGITLKCGAHAVVIDAAGVTLTGGAIAALTPRAAATPREPGDLGAGSLLTPGTTSEVSGAPPTGGDSWIGIELKDEEGHPMPRELYEVALADGSVIRGRLDDEGRARVEGISPGEAQITFPRFDQGNWRRA